MMKDRGPRACLARARRDFGRRVQKLERVWSKYSKAQRVSSLHLPEGQRSIQKALFAASHPVDEFGYPRPTA